jgi:protein-S-isoprenylcysteine O-methyltransferase Ste14
MNTTDPAQHRLGTVLVACQFMLIAALAALALPAFLAGEAPADAWLMAVAGALLGLWALSSNRPGNFNIRPTPREGGQLVQQGPYRWIRHPLYTAVVACGLACAWAGGSAWG